MTREYGRSIGLAVAASLPVIVVVAMLHGAGVMVAATAIVAGATGLVGALVAALLFASSLSALGGRIERLRPDAVQTPRTDPLVGSALWRAVLRFRAAWAGRLAQAEARLAAAEAVLAAIADPLLLIDSRRRIVRANAAATQFIGTLPEPRDLAGAIRNPALLAAVDAVLRGETVPSVEFTLSLPVERVLRAHLTRIGDGPDHGPALEGAVAIVTLNDVTALKRSEQMRADFIANAGHELKTPLASLIGFIETLLGPARKDAAARERFLRIMHEQARRMARLVDEMLSLSRIELNEHVPPTGRVALSPVVEEVARGLELRAAERGIRITLAVPPDLPDLQADRDELAQIFQNLIDNAVKYGRRDSEVVVTGGTGGTGAQVYLAVADQGEGIAGEHLPRLTERFYRVDTARSRELGGTGLGLAIVKHLVNRHRGRLDITSKPGQGSTFTVWLPAAAPGSGGSSSFRHETVIRAS